MGPQGERLRATVALAVLVLIAAGCSSGGGGPQAASTSVGTAGSTSTAPAGGAGPSTTGVPPATRGPTTITRNNLTVHVPAGWIAEGSLNSYGFGPVPRPPGTALIAVEALFGFTAAIDSLKPVACEAMATVNLPVPTSVTLVETGFRPVGDRTAEYRNWSVACPGGSVEGHRAWVLPQSRIAFYERCRMTEVGDVVATAEVSESPAQTSTSVRPPRPESPFSCKG